MKRLFYIALLSSCLLLSAGVFGLQAETYHSPQYGFAIDIPNDWERTQPKYARTLFSFAKMGPGENLNLNVYDAQSLTSIKQLSPRQMFHPFYDSLRISRKNYVYHNGTDSFKCIYTIKDRDLKRRLEGKYDLKYFVASWIKNGKQFTVTFTDSRVDFNGHLQIFERVIDSISYDN